MVQKKVDVKTTRQSRGGHNDDEPQTTENLLSRLAVLNRDREDIPPRPHDPNQELDRTNVNDAEVGAIRNRVIGILADIAERPLPPPLPNPPRPRQHPRTRGRQTGGNDAKTHKYNDREYKVCIGPNGGRYIVVTDKKKGGVKKIYI